MKCSSADFQPTFYPRRDSRRLNHGLFRGAIVALAALLIAACTTSPTGRSQFMLISPDAAIVQSKEAYLVTVGELDKENKLVDDPRMADRVATITGRLVSRDLPRSP